MNKRIMLYGVIAVAVIAAVVMVARNYRSIDKESEQFVAAAIEVMASAWDAKDFENLADPNLVKSMNRGGQGVEQLFAIYGTLGKLKEPANCTLINSGTLMKEQDNYDVATYHCMAEFDAGPAKVNITVRKDKAKEAWEIYYLKIESDSLGQH